MQDDAENYDNREFFALGNDDDDNDEVFVRPSALSSSKVAYNVTFATDDDNRPIELSSKNINNEVRKPLTEEPVSILNIPTNPSQRIFFNENDYMAQADEFFDDEEQ